MGSPIAAIALLLPLVRAAANCDRSPTPVYVYDADKIDNPWLAHAVDRLTRNLVPSAVAVADPSDACWFLVTSPAAAAGPFADAVALAAEAPLARLAHWGQCGANHAVFMSEHPDEETPSVCRADSQCRRNFPYASKKDRRSLVSMSPQLVRRKHRLSQK